MSLKGHLDYYLSINVLLKTFNRPRQRGANTLNSGLNSTHGLVPWMSNVRRDGAGEHAEANGLKSRLVLARTALVATHVVTEAVRRLLSQAPSISQLEQPNRQPIRLPSGTWCTSVRRRQEGLAIKNPGEGGLIAIHKPVESIPASLAV